MPLTREYLRNQVRANAGVRAEDDFADVKNDDGTPNPVTTNGQIDKYLDEARDVVCRNLMLIPGHGIAQGVVGQDTYKLSAFAAIRDVSGTAIPNGGDGTRLWTARKKFGGVKYNGINLIYTANTSAERWGSVVPIATNGIPSWWSYADERGESIILYPEPAAGQQIAVDGYAIPPSITVGAMAFDFLPDEEYGGIVSYATYKIAMQAQDVLGEKAGGIIAAHGTNWNTWSANRYATVPEEVRARYKMVPQLLPVGGG